MAADRWSVVSWPEEYGGRGVGPPRVAGLRGGVLAGPGPTAGEPERDLPARADPVRVRDRRAEGAVPARRWPRASEIWCQGWSEPDAGSDLAGIRSRARRSDGEGGWLLTGQKTWASRGAFAEWCFGLFRTDPEAERHRGLTYFLIDLAIARGDRPARSPRSTGRPASPSSSSRTCFVPDDAGARRRRPGLERGHGHRRIRAWAQPAQPGPLHRGGRPAGRSLRRAAGRATPVRAGAQRRRRGPGLDGRRGLPAEHAAGPPPGCSTAARSAPRRAPTRSTGPRPTWPSTAPPSPCSARTPSSTATGSTTPWLDGYLFALAGPIYAGTNEIQRNVVAERMLGLPRG